MGFRIKMFYLILFFSFLTFNAFAEEPAPFGLILGKSTKDEAISIMEKEGAVFIDSGYRVIKGDIVNPYVEGFDFENVPIENIQEATLWFFNETLFQIVYTFPLSMDKDEFYVMFEILKSKYGRPIKYVKPYLADGVAIWRFKDVEIRLLAPWVSSDMYVTYTHIPLFRKAEQSDYEVMKKETSTPKKGL
ncbi:hypothetical protein [Sulfurihydrogenibium sp.]|uniref:hypothetical protein n=1 Tax=Sulfurihydrogenibium sp. TaxID=2053621 RepID=UPI000CAA6887|nr:MAG: hypothetical protein C0198_05220 [Sulfurihydrogenibium sp.]